MSRDALILTNSYWEWLKSLSNEVKLRLETKLTASVIDDTHTTEKEYTEEMLNRYFGAWKDDRPTEDIIREIKEGNSSKPPIEL